MSQMPDLTLHHNRATWHVHLSGRDDDHIVTRLDLGDRVRMAGYGTEEWTRAVGLALRAVAFTETPLPNS